MDLPDQEKELGTKTFCLLTPALMGDEFQTILGCGEFSPPLHRLLWELLEWHAGVEPISHARSRRTVQVAQHDHRLARLRIHAKNRVHSRSAAAVAIGPRLVQPSELESEAASAGSDRRKQRPMSSAHPLLRSDPAEGNLDRFLELRQFSFEIGASFVSVSEISEGITSHTAKTFSLPARCPLMRLERC